MSPHALLVVSTTLAIVEGIGFIWAIGTIIRCQRQLDELRRWQGRAQKRQP